jgi:hypothetical protein
MVFIFAEIGELLSQIWTQEMMMSQSFRAATDLRAAYSDSPLKVVCWVLPCRVKKVMIKVFISYSLMCAFA